MPSPALVITFIALPAAVFLFKKSVYDPCTFPPLALLLPSKRLRTSPQPKRLTRRLPRVLAPFTICLRVDLSEKAEALVHQFEAHRLRRRLRRPRRSSKPDESDIDLTSTDPFHDSTSVSSEDEKSVLLDPSCSVWNPRTVRNESDARRRRPWGPKDEASEGGPSGEAGPPLGRDQAPLLASSLSVLETEGQCPKIRTSSWEKSFLGDHLDVPPSTLLTRPTPSAATDPQIDTPAQPIGHHQTPSESNSQALDADRNFGRIDTWRSAVPERSPVLPPTASVDRQHPAHDGPRPPLSSTGDDFSSWSDVPSGRTSPSPSVVPPPPSRSITTNPWSSLPTSNIPPASLSDFDPFGNGPTRASNPTSSRERSATLSSGSEESALLVNSRDRLSETGTPTASVRSGLETPFSEWSEVESQEGR